MNKYIYKLEKWYKSLGEKFLKGNGRNQNDLYEEFITTLNFQKWSLKKVITYPFRTLLKGRDWNTFRIVDVINEVDYFNVRSQLSGQQRKNLELLNESFYTKHESYWYDEGPLVNIVNWGHHGTGSPKKNFSAISIIITCFTAFFSLILFFILLSMLNSVDNEFIRNTITYFCFFVLFVTSLSFGFYFIPLTIRYYYCSTKSEQLIKQEFILYKSCLKKFIFVENIDDNFNFRLLTQEERILLIQENNVKTAIEHNFDYTWS